METFAFSSNVDRFVLLALLFARQESAGLQWRRVKRGDTSILHTCKTKGQAFVLCSDYSDMQKRESLIFTVDPDELVDAIAAAVLAKIKDQLSSLQPSAADDEQLYLKPREAGRMIGHSESLIRKLADEGKLSKYYPSSNLVISKKELLEYMERCKLRRE